MQYVWIPVKGFLGQLRHELRVDGITVLTTFDTRLAVEPYTEPKTKATVVWFADDGTLLVEYGGWSREGIENYVRKANEIRLAREGGC